MRSRYLLLFVLFASKFIWAQNYNPTERFTINKGLSYNEITCLYSDKKGFLWLGTTDGLNRFDGYNFVQYKAELHNPFSIPNDCIYKIAGDHHENIWCATEGGIFKLNLSDNTFTSFSQYSDTLLYPDFLPVYDFYIDTINNNIFFLSKSYFGKLDLASGYIERKSFDRNIANGEFNKDYHLNAKNDELLLTNSKGIYHYDIENDSISVQFEEQFDRLNNEGGIRGIQYGLNQEIWIYTPISVWLFKDNQEFTKRFSLSEIISNEKNILAFRQKSDTTFELFTSQGVLLYDYKHNSILSSVEFNFPFASKGQVSSCIFDRSGIYWVGTTNGLFKYNHHRNTIKHYDLSDYFNGSETDDISSAVFDRNGKLWLGLNSGKILVLDIQERNPQKAVLIRLNNNSRIHTLKKNKTGNIFVCSDEGLTEYIVPENNQYSFGTLRSKTFPVDDVVYCIGEEDETSWISVENEIIILKKNRTEDSDENGLSEIILPDPSFEITITPGFVYFLQTHQIVQFDQKDKLIQRVFLPDSGMSFYTSINTILSLNDKEILVGTSDGLYKYSPITHELSLVTINSLSITSSVNSLIQDNNGKIWIASVGDLISIDFEQSQVHFLGAQDGLNLGVFSTRGVAKDPAGKLLFFGNNEFIAFHPDSITGTQKRPNVIIPYAILSGKDKYDVRYLLRSDSLVVEPGYHNLRIYFSALNFWNPPRNQYKYSFERVNKNENWKSLGSRNYIDLYGIKAGIYSLKIMGSSSNGIWSSNSRDLIIQIKAPFWQSRIAILFYLIALIALFYFSVYFKTRQLRKINKEYKERELIGKKIELQKEELTIKNKNITDSINYAKRIQMALMPSQRLFSKLFPDSFILHIPKDIVSGDFYWINEVGERIYFAAVDCTGHGVPGAFMSVIGFELFRRITETERKKQPSEILNSLNRGFETVFSDVNNVILRDGMDVAFCAIDHEMKVLEFAGAFNPLYLVRDNTITEIKGDRFSVGLNDEDTNGKSFNNHVIPLLERDVIYIFTDGFADQFGGPEGKKYKYRRFRHLLLALHQLPMSRQGEFLKRSILDWKGSLDQVDDILVVGIRIGKSYPSK
ncbi:MAG: SpoIIE family protein phosphatase, partial [Bacteroidales bacterium]|nr:SpoIIE family protein phosphatase [Bacteroidales bacterium]